MQAPIHPSVPPLQLATPQGVCVPLFFVSGVYLRMSHQRSSDGDTSTVRLRL
ncbi:uncharacterized protein BO66DRAFT_396559, partial [Aspergillus aculeatinus CBS 121060]